MCANSASNCMISSEPSTIRNSISPVLSMSCTFVLSGRGSVQMWLRSCLMKSVPLSPFVMSVSCSCLRAS